MKYEFERTDGTVCEFDFPAKDAPTCDGTIITLPDGTAGRRILSRFQWNWNSAHAPRNDDDRQLAVKMFDEPNPANPGGVSDHQLVKQGDAITRDMKHSSFTTGTL